MIRKRCVLVFLSCLYVADLMACADYIAYREGESAIVLSSPHGATKDQLLPGVPPRQGGQVKRFVNRADQFTGWLTWRIAELLMQEGLSPFVVVAGVHRSQIDFNRSPQEAYESKAAEKCYQYYHQKISYSIDRVRQEWGGGILFDIHGQSKYEDDIIRGTRNNQTLQHLITQYQKDVTEDEDGFFTVLRQKGYKVTPGKFQREQYFYGGYTLRRYGSHQPDGIDAIQIEVGRDQRVISEKRERMAKDIAEAIRRFYQRYYQ